MTTPTSTIDQFLSWVQQILGSLGYLGLTLLIVLEQLVPPIPSTLILPVAGFMVSQGAWSLPGVLIAATAGSLISAMILYRLGRLLDERLLSRLAARHGRLIGLGPAQIERALAAFDRHGPALVFAGRFVGTVRSLISIPAGMRRMRLAIFLPLTALGSGLWNTLLVVGGMLLGERWAEIDTWLARYDDLLWLGLAMALVLLLGFRLWRRRGR